MKPIPNFPDYLIDKEGNVWSFKKYSGTCKRKLKQTPDRYGYLRVHLSSGATKKVMQVHKLMLLIFRGLPRENQQCRHLDGNQQNNHLNNLEWGTSKENHADRFKHGTRPLGIKNPNCKLSEKEVIAIYTAHGTERYLSKIFNVHHSQIRRIKNGKSWAHITSGFIPAKAVLEEYFG